ncbi:GTPase IMAP family member 9-like [Salarias fasciatus]|uniref:GTPase IMAP family member 8 n=1 Tax=Salarias fasciatus TaxID=181472 RepID=A0A672FI17_SALFA|nr:GTPase IMAP family member 9-like [Salarias fasciatus]
MSDMPGIKWEDLLRLGGEEEEEEEEACPEIRIVLLGDLGTGKSASGNTILGRAAFHSASSPSAVTLTCQREAGHFLSQQLVVVDTPGALDPSSQEADRCVSLAGPGPHVFMLVLEPRRFTEEDKRKAESLLRAFGEEAFHYTMVLFTHGDQLRARGVSIQTFVSQSAVLRGFLRKCGGRFHVLNNMSFSRAQVRNLLRKIRWMIQSNGGAFSISSMPRGGRAVSTGDPEEDRRREIRVIRVRREAPVYNIHLTRNIHIHNPPPERRGRSAVPWAALGGVLGMQFGPAGVAAGSVIGNMIGLLDDRL